MPVAGGLPVRRTFSGQNVGVIGWTPDAKIITATQKYSGLPDAQLVLVDPGRGETVIPLGQAADGAFDPSGKTLYFTRLPFQGSYTKRYAGGTAQNLWKYELGGNGRSRSPHGRLPRDEQGADGLERPRLFRERPRRDHEPVVDGPQGRRPQAAHLPQGARRQLAVPVQRPDRLSARLGPPRLRIASGKDAEIDIVLPSDFDQMREKWLTRPLEYLTSAHLSPSGDKVALVSRGRVFVAPAGPGRLAAVDRKEGVRRRSARFMPDGKSVVFLSDASGEWEFQRFPADGTGAGDALTTGAKVLRFDGIPSPDGKRIAFADKDNQLWVHDIEAKTTKRIAVSTRDAVGPGLVLRRALARLRRRREKRLQPSHALQRRRGRDDGAHGRPGGKLQPGLEPGRQVALFPFRPIFSERRREPLGAAPTRALFRQDDQDLRREPAGQGALPVRPGRRAPGRGQGARGQAEGPGGEAGRNSRQAGRETGGEARKARGPRGQDRARRDPVPGP